MLLAGGFGALLLAGGAVLGVQHLRGTEDAHPAASPSASDRPQAAASVAASVVAPGPVLAPPPAETVLATEAVDAGKPQAAAPPPPGPVRRAPAATPPPKHAPAAAPGKPADDMFNDTK
jgi:hypothetical protein